jgi:hypothetical protein
MTKKSGGTIQFRLITADQFHRYFSLESPGYYIALDAFKANEVATGEEIIEVMCLSTQLYLTELGTRLMQELHPLGKFEQYLELDTNHRAAFATQVLGKDRMAVILREVMDEVRRETMIGHNDKKSGKKKRRGV